MTRVVRCAIVLACLAGTSLAHGQATATTIVIAPRSAFADTLADRLRAGLESSAGDTVVRIEDNGAGCEESATTIDGSIDTVTTSLTILVAANASVAICTRARDTFTRRSVGPFAALDATAVEQIATMVEASLEALAAPSPQASDSSHAATTPTTSATTPTDESNATAPDDAASQPQTAPSGVNPADAAITSPYHAANTPRARDAAHHPRAWPIALTLGLGPTLWDAKSITIDGHLGARHRIGPRWLWLGLALTYGLPFERTVSGLGARFSILALDVLLVFNLNVADDVVIDLSLGPRAEWLFVRPFVVDGANATAGKDSYAFNLSGVLEASARFEVTRHLWLSASLGSSFASDPHAYGVERGEAFEVILDQSIPRPYLRVGALLAL